MVLSGKEIKHALKYSDLEIVREDGEISIEPSSVDLHLGPKYGKYEQQPHPVKVWESNSYPDSWVRDCREEIGANGVIEIEPQEFVLAHTEEVVNLPPKFVGQLEGRSSVGRMGLFVENAGLVDAGFHGDLTLELYNASKNTIWLKPGMRIIQMKIHEHGKEPEMAYSEENSNKYNGQRGPTPTRLFKDFQEGS